jgi:poly-beta-hydroxyalkanoate depolymerase
MTIAACSNSPIGANKFARDANNRGFAEKVVYAVPSELVAVSRKVVALSIWNSQLLWSFESHW